MAKKNNKAMTLLASLKEAAKKDLIKDQETRLRRLTRCKDAEDVRGFLNDDCGVYTSRATHRLIDKCQAEEGAL